MKCLRLLLVSAVVFVSAATRVEAAAFIADEICGDGVDNKQQYLGSEGSCPSGWVDAKSNGGCDMLCPRPDEDWDGFKEVEACDTGAGEKCDCAPQDKWVYPGSGLTTVGCTGGQVHECQDDGAFTACAAFACPSGKTCYFIDDSGSNTAAGSVGAPWRDLSKIAYWTNTPGFTVHEPAADEIFYLRAGTYTFDTALGYKSRVWACRNNTSASAAHPIEIASYPGERAIIQPSTSFANADGNAIFYSEGCDNFILRNLTIVGGYERGVALLSGSAGSDGWKIQNMVITQPAANGDNLGCIEVSASNDVTLQSNIGYDCYKAATASSANYANNHIFVTFRGVNLQMLYNTGFYTVLDTSPVNGDIVGTPFRQKHANYTTTAVLKGNVFFNGGVRCTVLAGGNFQVRNQLNYGCTDDVLVGDTGGTSFQTGHLNGGYLDIQDSTFIKSGGFDLNPTKQYDPTTNESTGGNRCSAVYTVGTYRFRNNVVTQTKTVYGQDDRSFRQHIYGPDFFYDLTKLSFTNNTWYNPNTDPSFGIQESNNGNETCDGRGVLGQSYTWAEWQALGMDTAASGSLKTNPGLDTFGRAANSGHTTKGRIKIGDEFTGTTPTTIPTTTTTAAPTTTTTSTTTSTSTTTTTTLPPGPGDASVHGSGFGRYIFRGGMRQ